MLLDRNLPYSQVYGSSRATFFQVVDGAGRYFDANGAEIPSEEAAQPNPMDAPDYVPPPATEPPADRKALLESMHAVHISKLVTEAGGTPATGDGSRAKNIAWLLENTA